MKLPLRVQILWPLLTLLLVAVAANALFSAWRMSAHSLRSLEARQQQIIGVLQESSFPLSANVVEKLRGLTGDEIVIWDSTEGRVVTGTISEPLDQNPTLASELNAMQEGQRLRRTIAGTTYVIRAGRIRGMPSLTLLVLTSDARIRATSNEAIWSPLAVGLATIVLSIPLTLFLASSWAQRINSLETHVGMIAKGEFGLELPAGTIDDELARLIGSINSMSRQLRSMKEQLIQGERTKLVAQLTAGFAHQLRNGLAGAKLAIQLHQSRCHDPTESSLAIASNQLALVEEEVQGLLSLGKGGSRPPALVALNRVIQSVHDLVILSCEHRDVQLTIESDSSEATVIGYSDGLRAALLNLTLNAIDATGPGGHVWLILSTEDSRCRLCVEDDGPGPPSSIGTTLFDSFVTSKPEGIGLGLAVASAVAQTHQGTLGWRRENNRTRFELVLPLTPVVEESPVG